MFGLHEESTGICKWEKPRDELLVEFKVDKNYLAIYSSTWLEICELESGKSIVSIGPNDR